MFALKDHALPLESAPGRPAVPHGRGAQDSNAASPTTLGRTAPNVAWDLSRIPARRSAPRAAAPTTKLAIGRTDDPLEREADRVADRVMRRSDAGIPVTSTTPRISRACAACEEEQEERTLRAKLAGAPMRQETAPAIVEDVLHTPGQPLDPENRVFFEPLFHHDFGRVRIHADARAAESARAVRARAYTVGQHVVFGRDQYAPQSPEGRHLIAHELTHTLQQRGDARGLQRADDSPPSSPPTPGAGLGARLQIVEESGPAAQARLGEIIRTGGPIPNETKVIGAAIIDVKGYQGPTEMRAISGANTDTLGQGAPVYHASSPSARTLSATRTIAGAGARHEFPFSHINDAEMKLFEDIIARLPPDAEGTIHFTTVRVRLVGGQMKFEAYPACSGCIRATFEFAGRLPKVTVVSHAPVHAPMGTVEPGEPPPSAGAPHPEATKPATATVETPVPGPATAPESAKVATPRVAVPSPEAAEGVPSAVAAESPVTTPGRGTLPTEELPSMPGRGGASGSGLAIFQLILLALQFLPELGGRDVVGERLSSALSDPKWRARFEELQAAVRRSKGILYFDIRFRIVYSASKGWHPKANTFYDVHAVEVQSIDLSTEKKSSCGKLDPPDKPADVQMGPYMSGYHWTATRDCEVGVVPHNPEVGPTYGLLSDSEIRDTVAAADAPSLTGIPLAERLRITNRLFEGYVSGPDLQAIKRLYTTTPQADRAALRQLIEQWIPKLTSIGQRTELRIMLSEPAP